MTVMNRNNSFYQRDTACAKESAHKEKRMKVMSRKKSNGDRSDFRLLCAILEGKHILPVYQPIVSLKNGQVFGYEALSRISNKAFELNIDHLFQMANTMNKSWELESLCRKRALKYAKDINPERKLFLNVDPNIIYDSEFQKGFTKNRLEKYGLESLDIVFEITERTAIMDMRTFLKAIGHYRGQQFKIAIDDVGSGYSGLNVINSIKPDMMKLDMNLIRDIDKDEIKQYLCKAMSDFGKKAGISLIAEGIETQEELQTLIKLNIEFGQGYYLGRPAENFAEIADEKIETVKRCQQ